MALHPEHRHDPPPTPEPQAAPAIDPYANKGPQDTPGTGAYSPGPQLFDPGLYAGGGGHSWVDNLTAAPGGTQAAALQLTQSINRITTARTAGDSVALPPATGGQIIVVRNAAGANAIRVYGANGSSDLINAQPGSTGIAVASLQTAMFISTPGRWFSILSA